MSSILKALKKLEHEKTVRKPDSFKIDSEILRGEAASGSRPFYTAASLAAISLFLCGVGATYLFMKHDNTTSPVQTVQVLNNETKGEPSTGPTLLPVPTTVAKETKPDRTVKVISISDKTNPSPRSIEKQQSQREKPAEIGPQPVTPEPKPVSPPVQAVRVVTTTAKPVLKVNGIAFQDGADSVAVINGITVSSGSMIEGARVEEIQKDRVKFSRDGETFYIILDKSN